jgi:putative DNA primase/helicase
MSTLDWVLSYASAGWKILPVWWIKPDGTCGCGDLQCSQVGKHPLTDKKLALLHGLKDATDNVEALRAIWTTHPQANVGGATGTISDWDVLDIDNKLGGFDSWQALQELHGGISPAIPTTRTPGGGRHYFFPHIDGISNARGSLPPGIDIRGSGGYVILPPSIGNSGLQYTWLTPISDVDRVGWPLWLLELIRTGNGKSAADSMLGAVDSLPPIIGEGMRNILLTSLAGSYRRRGQTSEEMFPSLWQTNLNRCLPPLSQEEVRRIIGHVMRYQPPEEEMFEATDIGNVEKFLKMFGDRLRYCQPMRKWFHWTGTRWSVDSSGYLMRCAKLLVYTMHAESEAIEDVERRSRYRQHIRRSASLTRMNAVVDLAKSDEHLVIQPDQLDPDRMKLNVSNGTIDLYSGVLSPHTREDLQTRCIPIVYDPTIPCPLWQSFVSQIMEGEMELVLFLQRLCGYFLTGDVSEDIFPICYGTGSNGKSTFVEILLEILGSYASSLEATMLLEHRNDPHPTGLADLYRRRVVFAVETPANQYLNEPLIKQLTGGDRVRARHMREDFWEFSPTHKLVLMTNHKPRIRGNGPAIWRRILVIPFSYLVPKGEIDRSLPEKLLAEAPGILAWMVRGCVAWQQRGIDPPALVREATEAYKQEQDILGAWISSDCVEGLHYFEKTENLYERYIWWLAKAGQHQAPTMYTFASTLTDRGYPRKEIGGDYYRVGLRFRTKEEQMA